jgi:hypothetical protein
MLMSAGGTQEGLPLILQDAKNRALADRPPRQGTVPWTVGVLRDAAQKTEEGLELTPREALDRDLALDAMSKHTIHNADGTISHQIIEPPQDVLRKVGALPFDDPKTTEPTKVGPGEVWIPEEGGSRTVKSIPIQSKKEAVLARKNVLEHLAKLTELVEKASAEGRTWSTSGPTGWVAGKYGHMPRMLSESLGIPLPLTDKDHLARNILSTLSAIELAAAPMLVAEKNPAIMERQKIQQVIGSFGTFLEHTDLTGMINAIDMLEQTLNNEYYSQFK